MKEIFLKYKIVIFRVLGVIMLLVGFAIYFWETPKEGMSQSEIAAANVARMEASVSGSSSSSAKETIKPNGSKFLEEFKNSKKKQLEYLTIFSMIFGAVFLFYSFFGKSKSDSER